MSVFSRAKKAPQNNSFNTLITPAGARFASQQPARLCPRRIHLHTNADPIRSDPIQARAAGLFAHVFLVTRLTRVTPPFNFF
jgi:hypothetical protein